MTSNHNLVRGSVCDIYKAVSLFCVLSLTVTKIHDCSWLAVCASMHTARTRLQYLSHHRLVHGEISAAGMSTFLVNGSPNLHSLDWHLTVCLDSTAVERGYRVALIGTTCLAGQLGKTRYSSVLIL